MDTGSSLPSSKLNVLVAGALPPPMGGVGFYYQTLLDSNLTELVNLHFVQTSTQNRELSSSGKVTAFNFIAALQDCWRFSSAIIWHRPQLAHISTASGLSLLKHSLCILVARLFGCRVLLHPHCSLPALYHERSRWWRWYFRKVIYLTDGIVALSKEWLELGSIIPGRKVYYLPNAINLRLYHEVAVNHLSKAQLKNPCKVLYLGYLGKAKGSFDLLDAAITIHTRGIKMIFDLVGGEMSHEEWVQLNDKIAASKMEDDFRLHPLTFGAEKVDFFDQADIFVYPSYFEGMPIAVIEAMACGLPVVASNVGGLPDLIKDGVNGILVTPGNPDELASALCTLAGDQSLHHSMALASYKLAYEGFDIDKHVTELVGIYKAVLSDDREAY